MSARLLVGDAAAVLGTLDAGSAQLCVTSPPYLGLRRYEGPDMVFGGDAGCSHEWGEEERGKTAGGGGNVGINQRKEKFDGRPRPGLTSKVEGQGGAECSRGSLCRLCSAWRGQLGLEPTPDLFIEHLVAIFAEVRRVLHPTGVLAVNMGDSYANTGGHSGQSDTSCRLGRSNVSAQHAVKGTIPPGIPAGNLLGMPWRLAFALQRDGWILRSAVTLCKLSPMPESVSGCRWERCRVKVAEGQSPARNFRPELGCGGSIGGRATAEYTDCPGCEKCAPNGGLVLRWGSGRPTSSTEMLFIFAKSARYYFDCDAVRVPQSERTLTALGPDCIRKNGAKYTAPDSGVKAFDKPNGALPNGRNAWNYQRFEEASDVWEWRPSPFSEAHFATFPVSLPTWCIKAATPEAGCCSACGMPWARVVEREGGTYADRKAAGVGGPYNMRPELYSSAGRMGGSRSVALGHRPTCQCNAPGRPAVVLDPFAGAGTTLLAADRLGRDSIGVEISESYAAMARERLTADAGLFAEIGTE